MTQLSRPCSENVLGKHRAEVSEGDRVELTPIYHTGSWTFDRTNKVETVWWTFVQDERSTIRLISVFISPYMTAQWNIRYYNNYTHTHTHIRLTALCPGLPGWAGAKKIKPIWILLKQETVSSSGISWAICKSAPRSRQITTPAPHCSVFTDQMPFLPPNQQRQSTEGHYITITTKNIKHTKRAHQENFKKTTKLQKDWTIKNCTELSESARQHVSTNQSSSEIFHVALYTAGLCHAVQDTVWYEK